MAFGLDENGFSRKTLADLRDSLDARLKDQLGPEVEIDSDGPEGVIAGGLAIELDEIWQALQALYDSFVPGNAQGVQQDNLAGVKGLTRLDATYTAATVQLRGTPTTVVPAGTLFSKGTGGDQYELDEDVTLVADYFGAGDDGGEGEVIAVEIGYRTAPAATIDTIVTPVAGLDSVTNDDAATPGRDEESDEELQVRMAGSGQIIGATTVEAIRARLLELEGVQAAKVIENETDVTDGDGRPPHSFEAVVFPDTVDDASIAELLWLNKPAGIRTYGAENHVITDSQGQNHTMNWSFAAGVDVDINVVRTTDSDYPPDGDDQIEEAIREYLAGLSIGDDVLHHLVVAAIAEVPGIVTLVVTMRRDADPYTAANVTIDDDEVAEEGVIAVS